MLFTPRVENTSMKGHTFDHHPKVHAHEVRTSNRHRVYHKSRYMFPCEVPLIKDEDVPTQKRYSEQLFRDLHNHQILTPCCWYLKFWRGLSRFSASRKTSLFSVLRNGPTSQCRQFIAEVQSVKLLWRQSMAYSLLATVIFTSPTLNVPEHSIHRYKTAHWVTQHADDMANVNVILNVSVDCTYKLVSVSQRYQRNCNG